MCSNLCFCTEVKLCMVISKNMCLFVLKCARMLFQIYEIVSLIYFISLLKIYIPVHRRRRLLVIYELHNLERRYMRDCSG